MGFSIKKTGTPGNDSGGTSKKKSSPAKKKKSGSNPFRKTGAAAKQALEQAQAEAAARQSQYGKEYRFWLPEGEDAMVTFLNGELSEETGILDIDYVNEHRVKVDGKWRDIVCIEDEEPCPLCAAGERRSFIGLISILDHREREYEKDGKTVKVEVTRRIMPCKNETLKMLTKIAQKYEGGLKYSTFEVSRTGKKKANVGDLFVHAQTDTEEDLEETFGDMIKPITFEDAVTIYTADEMSKLGIGKKVATFGSKSSGGKGADADDIDDDDEPW